MSRYFARTLLGGLLIAASSTLTGERLPPGVACLLEENGAELLPLLTNPSGDQGEGQVEEKVVFSGRSSIKITVYQKYCNFLPGWAYRIAENPRLGEYRYLRFAWKGEGVSGIMLQLHDDKDWHIRYTAGTNKFGWESKTLADTAPQEWTLVTIDLFKDFGPRELHGIALTQFDGTAGYFDHIYLARSLDELDAIDATGLTERGGLNLKPDEVKEHWANLAHQDAAVAYRAFWTLVNGGESARQELERQAGGKQVPADADRIARWLQELDHDNYAIREEATRQLEAHGRPAQQALQQELARTTSFEVKLRLKTILARFEQLPGAPVRPEVQARKILRLIDSRSRPAEPAGSSRPMPTASAPASPPAR